jgi:hypothetical protein
MTVMQAMETELAGWTAEEARIARLAFDRAYARAVATLIETLQERVHGLRTVEAVWQVHDYLSIQRHEIEGRFDFREPGLLFVFAGLLKDRLLSREELDGLEPVKLAKILAMATMA